MIEGIIIDFLITFLTCFIIYKNIYKDQRPNAKSIFITIGLGVISFGITLALSLLLDFLITIYIDIFLFVFIEEITIVNILYSSVRNILLFVIIEEVAKYFLFDHFWNNGNIKLNSPLQTTLLFVIVGGVFSFGEDVKYILQGTEPFARILTIISGHLVYALIYSRYFSKEVIRMKASYMMEDFLAVLKNNNKYWNPFMESSKHQFNGLKISIVVHFVHNLFCQFASWLVVLIEVGILTIYFIKKIKKMVKNDTPYEILAGERIYDYFPNLTRDLEKAKTDQ